MRWTLSTAVIEGPAIHRGQSPVASDVRSIPGSASGGGGRRGSFPCLNRRYRSFRGKKCSGFPLSGDEGLHFPSQPHEAHPGDIARLAMEMTFPRGLEYPVSNPVHSRGFTNVRLLVVPVNARATSSTMPRACLRLHMGVQFPPNAL